MDQKTHPFQALLGNLAVPIITAPAIILKEKYIERENWHAAWRLLGLRRLSLSGKGKRTAIYLSTSPGCLVAQPVVFVNIWNMNKVIRMATTGPSFKYYPAYFLYYLCYSHISIFRMDPKHVFSEKALGRAWSQMLCGTPAGCFAIPVQQKANLVLQPGHSLLLTSLFWHRKDYFCLWKRRVSKTLFFTLLPVGKLYHSVTLTAAHAV